MSTSNTSTLTISGLDDALERVAAKQHEWRGLSLERKISLLEQLQVQMRELNCDDEGGILWEAASQTIAMMGYSSPSDDSEGQCQMWEQMLPLVHMVQTNLQLLLEAYRVRAGKAEPRNISCRRACNGQVVANVLPSTASDKYGPYGQCRGEIWLDPGFVSEPDQVKTYDLEFFYDGDEPGAMLVLGAGNQGFLSVCDVLYGLFHCQRVVYLKQHPLLGGLDGLIRHIFKPLMELGYFDTELDAGIERCKQLVYADSVSHVHLTGGKATHDAIVWGDDTDGTTKQQDKKLKAKITSELGAVTPWIVFPGEYTAQELEHQAKHLVSSVHNNASANCNAPKVLVLSQSWPQRQQFLSMVREEWENHLSPCAYYPGSKQRWHMFQSKYPNARQVHSKLNDQKRHLSTPLLGKGGPVLLPLLFIEVEVNLSTETGREAAMSEYAFRNEPFAPVLTVATIESEDVSSFHRTAVDLCNSYIFGSLSCSMTVPSDLDHSPMLEDAISSLRYGSIVINGWSALAYVLPGLTWGAFPGESLESVESGIGHVQNLLFVPHAQKSVVRMPLMAKQLQMCLQRDLSKRLRKARSTVEFVLHPGPLNLVKMLLASAGIELPSKTTTALVVAVAAMAIHRLQSRSDKSWF